jgi:hypothetical protein
MPSCGICRRALTCHTLHLACMRICRTSKADQWSITSVQALRPRRPLCESFKPRRIHAGSACVRRLPQRNEMRSASVYLPAQATAVVASVPFSGPTTVRQFDCSWPRSNPFRPNLRGNPQGLWSADIPSQDIAEAPTSGFTPANQTWEEMVEIGFAPRVHPLLPPQVRSWEPSEPTHIQPPSLVSNGTRLVEPALPQNAENDDDMYPFLCEWADERGTCNMVVLGDRVWMSHHLSRRHNVVGHEKSQRTCLWRGCTHTMNKGSLARHVVSRHLRAGASCGFCSKVYSRADVARRHTKKCKVANGASAQRDQTKW